MTMDRTAIVETVPEASGVERLIVGVSAVVLGVLLLGAAGFASSIRSTTPPMTAAMLSPFPVTEVR